MATFFIYFSRSKKINFKLLIAGIGTDIIEVERIARELKKESKLKEKLFTPFEISYCDPKRHPEQHYAARFAAKEAFFKALGTGWRYGMEYAEIEIQNNELGKPELQLRGKTKEFADSKGITRINVSISHLNKYATAFVIIENEFNN